MREFSMLQHVFAANQQLGPAVVIPPGDDLAEIELAGSRSVLIGVDQLVVGVHCTPDTPTELVGRKAITRCLSDVAGMAARPLGCVVAVTLPEDYGESSALTLFEAMRATAAAYNCPLIGGDISIHQQPDHPLVCSMTVLAEPAGNRSITRSAAQPGDRVYVTGTLGGAIKADGTGKHLTFEPRIELAVEILDLLGDRLHAMIDLSDGLGRDASHLAEMSHVDIELQAELIPCSPGCDWKKALGDGEDYELCFCARGEVPEMIGGIRITAVGDVKSANADQGVVTMIADGVSLPAGQFGWQHTAR